MQKQQINQNWSIIYKELEYPFFFLICQEIKEKKKTEEWFQSKGVW